MDAIYTARYGDLGARVFQLHCLLTANGHMSWFTPTGQNQIDWEPSGWNYVMDLYQWYVDHRTEHQPICNNMELFVKALLRQELVLPDYLLL